MITPRSMTFAYRQHACLGDGIMITLFVVGALMVLMGAATRTHPHVHPERGLPLLFRHRVLQQYESTTPTTLEEFISWLQSTTRETDVCHVVNVNQKVATTITTSSAFTVWLHLWLHPHDMPGNCADVCEQICFGLDENLCHIVDPDTGDCACPPIETCELNTVDAAPEGSEEYQYGAACTRFPIVCDAFPFQECVAQPDGISLCRCQTGFAPSTVTGECVSKCANPGGNPCGPGSACVDDDELGFTCKSMVTPSVCPVGCPPTELCVNGTCQCKDGFVRPDSFLPCAPK